MLTFPASKFCLNLINNKLEGLFRGSRMDFAPLELD